MFDSHDHHTEIPTRAQSDAPDVTAGGTTHQLLGQVIAIGVGCRVGN